ncbi:MAG: preprotein translocase subunit SecA [Patescibacteria group bacterium]
MQNVADQVQRPHHYAVIDEVDSILIDEARTPLIIAAPDAQSSEYYKTFARVVSRLTRDEDYTVDEKLKVVRILDSGIEKVEKALNIQNIYTPENLRLVHYLEESLKAHALFRLDKDYVNKNGEIVIVDEFTGRLLHGRRYNGGLHQAIEAKEGVHIKEESRTYAKISIQNYFRLYKKIAGMTGTAQTSAEEFHKVYNLEVTSIPTNRPTAREDMSDAIYKNSEVKWGAIVQKVEELYQKGQPVLLGTTSIEKNEMLSRQLTRAGIPHELLNAKNNEREGSIIAQAGKFKAVTVATNMAGRGVDVILGGNPPDPELAKKVKDLGGLFVIGTERHEARRIDNQLRGRSGRQGDPGASQFFLSLDDDLMRIFGGERVKSLMERFRLPDDLPIDMPVISRVVGEAQAKVEGANFDMRKHLLEYDDVLNKQRIAVYKRRNEILTSFEKKVLAEKVREAILGHLEKINQQVEISENPIETWEEIKKTILTAKIVPNDFSWGELGEIENVREEIARQSEEIAGQPQTINRLLGILDMLWLNHLENNEALSESIGLRAYGQHDPLVEYRRESHRLFTEFWDMFNAWVFENIFRLAEATNDQQLITNNQNVPVTSHQSSVVSSPTGEKVGRNDPCPCGATNTDGSPKKYKHCHGK